MKSLRSVRLLLLVQLADGLGLGPDYFLERYTRDPTLFFRIFLQLSACDDRRRCTYQKGVGEHTDYGLLTLLRQDEVGGLEIWHRDHWLPAPPAPDSFVCNVGAILLQSLTAGRYVSALHRVRNVSKQDRISMPLFLDPSFDAELAPIKRHWRLILWPLAGGGAAVDGMALDLAAAESVATYGDGSAAERSRRYSHSCERKCSKR